MRLATFNLLHGARPGDPGQCRPADLASAVAALDADVLALQEVDVGQSRSSGVDQAAVAAAAMAAVDYRFVPVRRGDVGAGAGARDAGAGDRSRATSEPQVGGAAGRAQAAGVGTGGAAAAGGAAYGIALLTRFPARRWWVMSFPAARARLPLWVSDLGRPRVRLVADEPRAAVMTVVETPGGPLTVVATHLSFVPGANVAQLRTLRRAVVGMPRPLLLLGDLNLPGTLPARLTGFRSLAGVATYPTLRPRVAFDHVLADGLPGPVVAGASATAVPLPISDHRALAVDLPPPFP